MTSSSPQFSVRAKELIRSRKNYQRAMASLPGGTTRVTVARLPIPIYMRYGEGAFVIDVDGNRYLDLNNNFTTLIHGHAFEPVTTAIERQLRRGSCFANPTESEIALAEILCARVPFVEQVRFVNTGTEAVMFAIKAARALTGRYKIAKFEGAYHGAYDWAEVSQGSAPANWGDPYPASIPAAAGTPPSVLEEVVVLPANDIDAMTTLIEQNRRDLACVVVDLLPSRPGLIPCSQDFLQALRTITRQHGILMVDDEVLNFRQGYSGAAVHFGIEPDLIALGKIIGGGFPIGAIAGPAEMMSVFDSSHAKPLVPQGGTFSANPFSMIAGIAALKELDPKAFEHLESLGKHARAGLKEVIAKHEAPLSLTGRGSLFRIHPKAEPPANYREAYQSPEEATVMEHITRAMLPHGIMMPPAAASALSTPMTEADIDHMITAFDAVLTEKNGS